MDTVKLEKKVIYNGVITLKTGLHIGGTNAALNIGGPDKFVVRNPISNKPYIPGSSLKGKLRSLVEISHGIVEADNKGNYYASKDPKSLSGQLFGVATGDSTNRPSRLIVRDCELITPDEVFVNTDLPYTESKTEVAIDRLTASANPRTFERVPAGAQFKLSMVLNVFDGDNEELLKKTLAEAIDILQVDYLGGHGSRGYGQVEITLEEPKDLNY